MFLLAVAGRSAKSLESTHPAELPLSDLAVICELEDEQARTGHFTRIFPTTESRYYYQFFENPTKYVGGRGGR